MGAAERYEFFSEQNYLRLEESSDVKHEYREGVIYAMAGAKNSHNRIAGNGFASLHSKLKGKSCQPFTSDTKVRITRISGVTHYYPDFLVVCEENPPDDTFQEKPVVIAEVVSSSTRRIDEGEKLDAYLTIPSLMVYLLVEQDEPAVVVHRRGERGFTRELHTGLVATIPLPEIDAELALADLYDGVVFGSAE
ncbi:MAG: Uma2 family endonuclease [Verrucomicrobiota bacterium]